MTIASLSILVKAFNNSQIVLSLHVGYKINVSMRGMNSKNTSVEPRADPTYDGVVLNYSQLYEMRRFALNI